MNLQTNYKRIQQIYIYSQTLGWVHGKRMRITPIIMHNLGSQHLYHPWISADIKSKSQKSLSFEKGTKCFVISNITSR